MPERESKFVVTQRISKHEAQLKWFIRARRAPLGRRKPRQEPKGQERRCKSKQLVKLGAGGQLGQNEEPSFDS